MLGLKIYSDGRAVVFPAVPKERVQREGLAPVYNRDKRARNHANSMVRKIFCGVRALKMMSPGACFFTVTSAGRPGRLYKVEIDALFTYLRKCHGLMSYVWVREQTKQGYDHLHVVAMFKPSYRMKYWIGGRDAAAPSVSRWWSRLLGQPEAANSIRFGWYNSRGKRLFYLSKEFGGGYCAKYLTKGKGIAGFRRVAFSQDVSKYTIPVTYYSEIREIGSRQVYALTVRGWKWITLPETKRYFGTYPQELLRNWFWQCVRNDRLGFEVFIGKPKFRLPLFEASEILGFFHIKNTEIPPA